MLEDKSDPAHAAISSLLRELGAGGSGGGGGGSGGGLNARIQSAGLAEHTSQKIHK